MALALAALLFASLVAKVEIQSNDDTYIYFNYARNAAEGRPFAYDNRGIPSEGFTSPLYLALLVPFEAVGAPMMFVAAAANLLALLVTLLASAGLLRDARALDRHELPAFGVILLALLVFDEHVATVIGRGLETLLGPMFVVLALWCGVRWLDPERSGRDRSAAGFLLAAFLAFLVRPENLVPLGACGGLLLLLGPASARPRLLVQAAIFVTSLLGYHGLKILVFGDVFATAWYRKMRFDGAGVDYVLAAAGAYAVELACLGALLAALLCSERRGERGGSWTPGLALLAVAALGSVVAVLPTRPLIGYAFRYLANTSLLLHLGVALATVRLVRVCMRDAEPRSVGLAGIALASAFGLAAATTAFGAARVGSFDDLRQRLDLRARAVEDAEDHHYLALGRFLRERLPAHEDISVAFGDAGALPYAFQSRFLDLNGLTEPAVAHLFRLDDGDQKTRRFIDYVLAERPDIVVLGFGPRNADGSYSAFANEHSPFRGPLPLAVHRSLRDAGLGFVCSIRAYYDLHIGVAGGSPHAREITAALQDYCRAHGYAIGEAFVVRDAREAVVFPPLGSQAPP